MLDRLVERTLRQRNQGRWDPERSRMDQGGPYAMSSGHRRCVHNDDSAVRFVRLLVDMDYLGTYMLIQLVAVSFVEEETSLGHTRRSKKLKRR
jgi:hypothetical protein